MKKRLLKICVIASLLVFMGGFVNAQNKIQSSLNPSASVARTMSSNYTPDLSGKAPIISESFDGTTFPPTGWVTTGGTAATWTRATAGTYPACSPHSGAALALFNSWTASAGDTATLVTPSFSCVGNTGLFTVSFWMFHDQGYTNDDSVSVYVNTTADLTGTPVWIGMADRPVGTGWLQHTFSIPGSITGATEYVIFKGTSRYGNDVHIDDILISSPSANDVGITAILAPTTPMLPGAVVPQITVKNFGTATQTNIPVNYKIGIAGTPVTTTIASLASGASTNVSFPSWTATNGTYDFIFYTNLTGDAALANDTMKRTVLVSNVTWVAGANTTLLGYMGSAASCNGKVYAMGGNQPSAAASGVAIYDVATDTWASGTALPAARVIGMAAATSTKVYYMGGSDGTTYQNTVWELTPPGTTWAVKAPLPGVLGWAKTVVYQDSLIYVVGGNDGTNVSANVYLYNNVNDTWRTCTPMPDSAFGGACGIVGNTIVWTTGIKASIQSTTYKGVIDAVDHATIVWTTGADIPTNLFRTDGGNWGPDEIIVATGASSTAWTPATPSPCYAYNPATDSWRTLTPKTTPTLGGFTATLLYASTPTLQTWKIVSASGYDGAAACANTEILTEDIVITGLISNSIAKFSIYPNPASDVLNIASDKVINSVKIYNIAGQLVFDNAIKAAKTEINISSFENGMYILKIESADGISVQKFNIAK